METNSKEIVFSIREGSGIDVREGVFSPADKEEVKNLNELIRKNKIRVSGTVPGEKGTAYQFYQATGSRGISAFLQSLQKVSWIESAYLKPASEDPSN